MRPSCKNVADPPQQSNNRHFRKVYATPITMICLQIVIFSCQNHPLGALEVLAFYRDEVYEFLIIFLHSSSTFMMGGGSANISYLTRFKENLK